MTKYTRLKNETGERKYFMTKQLLQLRGFHREFAKVFIEPSKSLQRLMAPFSIHSAYFLFEQVAENDHDATTGSMRYEISSGRAKWGRANGGGSASMSGQ